MTWLSILIPTIEEREALYRRLRGHLEDQIAAAGLGDEVEIVALCDDRTMTIGEKRNALARAASGEYVVYVDDDDVVADDYVVRITEAIRAHPGVDCIGIRAEMTFRGTHPRPIEYSRRHTEWRTVAGVYQRPPQHLNPIRREIVLRYPYAHVRYSEDADWSLRVSRDGAIRTEALVEATLYHYRSRRRWAYQWTLDRTERVRHALGIQMVNRFVPVRAAARILARLRGADA